MTSTHQLAAIMFTDIVGYTALMGTDEKKAFDYLNNNRLLQKPIIEQYHGRWIKELGDGVMSSFSAVSDAVNAAIDIMKACKSSNEFQLRIGIHVGEVVFENEDILGDGVNIAARIQSAANPASIYISEQAFRNITNKKNIVTRFVKEETLKNVKDPVRMYEVLTGDDAHHALTTIHKPNNGTAEKSIAVLPFVNMSNDPEQGYFCDGITEEIINALAQLDNLRVVARTSAFSFKEKNIDVREIGKTLHVKTLLEGSVRKAGDRLRIVTQLVNVDDGTHLWSNRYDRVLEDIFSIQEDIANNVATSLKGFLTSKEKEVIRRPETIIEAYEYFLKGRQLYHKLFLSEAREMFEKAIAVDKDYALAYAGLADAYSWIYEWEGGTAQDLAAAENHSLKALTLAPNMSESHTSRAYVLALAKKYDEAEKEFDEAIRLNSNSFDAYYLYGRACFAQGKIAQSADLLLKASEVRREDFQSVLLRSQSLRIIGEATLAKAVEYEGIARARKQLELNPNDRRVLTLVPISLYLVGQKEEAFAWLHKAFELYPDDAGALINGACLYAMAGIKDKALDCLEKAVNKGYGKRDWIENDPDYDNLREEPRFIALLKKLK